MTDPAYAATIKAARYQKRFEDTTGEEYSALASCMAWLKLRDFSCGIAQGRFPIGVMLGERKLGTWTKLDAQDRDDLNGIIFSVSGDFRRGAVVLCLNSRAPQAVIDAFLAAPADEAARAHVEGAPA